MLNSWMGLGNWVGLELDIKGELRARAWQRPGAGLRHGKCVGAWTRVWVGHHAILNEVLIHDSWPCLLAGNAAKRC